MLLIIAHCLHNFPVKVAQVVLAIHRRNRVILKNSFRPLTSGQFMGKKRGFCCKWRVCVIMSLPEANYDTSKGADTRNLEEVV